VVAGDVVKPWQSVTSMKVLLAGSTCTPTTLKFPKPSFPLTVAMSGFSLWAVKDDGSQPPSETLKLLGRQIQLPPVKTQWIKLGETTSRPGVGVGVGGGVGVTTGVGVGVGVTAGVDVEGGGGDTAELVPHPALITEAVVRSRIATGSSNFRIVESSG
jgi:hypothetical protein